MTADQHEALHHDGEHVLAAHQPAVEEGQSGRHQHDESGADKHPTGIARVYARHVYSFVLGPSARV